MEEKKRGNFQITCAAISGLHCKHHMFTVVAQASSGCSTTSCSTTGGSTTGGSTTGSSATSSKRNPTTPGTGGGTVSVTTMAAVSTGALSLSASSTLNTRAKIVSPCAHLNGPASRTSFATSTVLAVSLLMKNSTLRRTTSNSSAVTGSNCSVAKNMFGFPSWIKSVIPFGGGSVLGREYIT